MRRERIKERVKKKNKRTKQVNAEGKDNEPNCSKKRIRRKTIARKLHKRN